MKILRQIGATIAGMLAGGISVAIVQLISSFLYPMPEGVDPSKTSSEFTEWIQTLPVGAFLIVVASWATGCFVGAMVGRFVAADRSTIPGMLAWAFLTAATIFDLFSISHPLWVWFAGISVCLVFGLLGLVFAAPKEYVVKCVRKIKAPIGIVFKTLATIEEFSKAVPGIVDVEFLSETHYGVGTRFRETRMMNGKEAKASLEVTELVENEHLRIVSDEGGTIWDTIFGVKQQEDGIVEMTLQMDARPHNFFAKILTPMIINMVGSFVEKDMDSVKQYCEKGGAE